MLAFLPFARRSRRWRRRRRRRFGRNFPSWRRCRWSRWQRPEKKQKVKSSSQSTLQLVLRVSDCQQPAFFTQILSKVQPDKTTTKPKMIRTFNPSLILGKKYIFLQIFRWKTVEKKSFARWNFSIQRKTLDSQFFLHHGSATLSSFGDSDATGGTNARNGFEKNC